MTSFVCMVEIAIIVDKRVNKTAEKGISKNDQSYPGYPWRAREPARVRKQSIADWTNKFFALIGWKITKFSWLILKPVMIVL